MRLKPLLRPCKEKTLSLPWLHFSLLLKAQPLVPKGIQTPDFLRDVAVAAPQSQHFLPPSKGLPWSIWRPSGLPHMARGSPRLQPVIMRSRRNQCVSALSCLWFLWKPNPILVIPSSMHWNEFGQNKMNEVLNCNVFGIVLICLLVLSLQGSLVQFFFATHSMRNSFFKK